MAGSERATGPGERHARQADAEKHEALFQAYRARLAAATAAISRHDVADAARQLEAAPEALRGWEWRHLRSRLDDSSSVIPLPAGRAGLPALPRPDRLRVGILTGAGLRLTDLEGGETSRQCRSPPTRVPLVPERSPDPPRTSGRGVGR